MPRRCIFVYQEGQTWVVMHSQPGQNNIVAKSLAEAIGYAKMLDPRAVVLLRHAKVQGKSVKKRSHR